ncbi:DUF6316 family protein [uncultured Porticoccus sp.]|uniref:DUF6316 family protein n=1 Tax=uncultured Porticoccus sp. TaxID=1256050 RepID=UPI00260658D1|nr:DUF6316 family protein [uncultured Porticoccus sp.]
MSGSDDDTPHDAPSHRKGDADDSVHFRSYRIHCINGRWYFLTREGGTVGPFSTRKEAETHLSEFLKHVRP